MDGFKKHFSLARLGLFLWLSLIAFVGITQSADPVSWQGSYIEQFAAQFPNIFGVLAAILLLPVYAVSTLESLLSLGGISFSSFVMLPLYTLLAVVYLYWLSGWLANKALKGWTA